MYDFDSDNVAGAHPAILQALMDCNKGKAAAYGQDDQTKALQNRLNELFECKVWLFLVPTGTAANGLALGAMTPPYGTVTCHKSAHIITTECGAPEFYSAGARMVLLEGQHQKISPAELAASLQKQASGSVHHLAPSAVSITQASECGVCYGRDEVQELTQISHFHGTKLHMDGARFANAMVRLGLTPAEMSWKAGVDCLSFGSTKNGTLNAEAVLVFDDEIAAKTRFLHKRAGHLFSKMRFMSAQLNAYFKDDLWLDNALQANRMAEKMRNELDRLEGVTFAHPTQINEIFAHIPAHHVQALEVMGVRLRPWPHPKQDLYRLVLSFEEEETILAPFQALAQQSVLSH